MATIMFLFRCLVCGYEMETKINRSFDCPCCGKGHKMSFITTVRKE